MLKYGEMVRNISKHFNAFFYNVYSLIKIFFVDIFCFSVFPVLLFVLGYLSQTYYFVFSY